jgi:Lrp/AsnC family transcriptional regulator
MQKILAYIGRFSETEFVMFDQRDRKILELLQVQADMPIADLADRVNLSISACWRRIKRLEEDGFITARVTVLDRRKMNLPMTVFVMLRASKHTVEWIDQFRKVLSDIPEIVDAHRLTGDCDYVLKLLLPNIEYYDVIYKKLVAKLEFQSVSSYISMEQLKATLAVPTQHL